MDHSGDRKPFFALFPALLLSGAASDRQRSSGGLSPSPSCLTGDTCNAALCFIIVSLRLG